MKLTIITPCLNAEHYIQETVESVLGQTAIVTGRAALEYLVYDGCSSDRTMSILTSYQHDSLSLFSEPDSGMYNALAKGLNRASGDIIAYLNAGDYYDIHAFDVVLDIFKEQPVKWLTGCTVIYNERSQITCMKLPFKYRKRFFDCGMYGRYLNPIQQESTFWSASLNSLIDLDVLSQFKYAGDFYLWYRFASAVELHIVETHLGGFKYHRGQLSENLDAYVEELKAMTREPRMYEYALAFIDRILSVAPSEVKKYLNNNYLYRYDHREQRWI
jgi:glycosyltransferase involved in cell wall biosynthesis